MGVNFSGRANLIAATNTLAEKQSLAKAHAENFEIA
jgi:hypothetical protein